MCAKIIIQEDAELLTEESQIISNVQGIGENNYDFDEYFKKLDETIKKKLKMYNLLNQKLQIFKYN